MMMLYDKVKSLNGYDAIREKLDEGNTMTVKQPVGDLARDLEAPERQGLVPGRP